MTLANEDNYEFDVSVVMPSYNSENFIRASVGSVINQTDVKVELIVVDDEGQDATREILEQLKADNPGLPMTLIYRPGGLGQSTARNAGIDVAKGKYIALLDSDDELFATNTLADWVSYADRLNLDIACGQYMHVPLSGKARPARALVETGEKVVTTLTEPALVNATSCWQLLYNRSFLTRTNTRFSENLRQREDRLFVVQALLAADRIGSSAQFVVNHFDVPNSSFKQINRDQLEQFLQHVEELNDSFDQMRDAGRVGVEFETANCLIYFLQLINYWGGFVVRMMEENPDDVLIKRLIREYQRISANTDAFFENDQLNVSLTAQGAHRECVADVLKLCVLESKFDLILRILRNERLSYPDFRSLNSLDLLTDRIVTRYLSFNRDWTKSTTAPPISSKKLSDLVERIIIHVGIPKTGSSSLQQTLEANRFQLLEQGVLYPLCGAFREVGIRRERTPGHARFFNRILDGDPSVLPNLCGEIEECGRKIHTVILSSENILSQRFWRNGKGFEQIIKSLDFANIEIVGVFREHGTWIKSAFMEMHANPMNGFHSPIEAFEEFLEKQGLLDYEACIDKLGTPTCVKSVQVGSVEKIKAEEGLVSWFCNAVGLDSASWVSIDNVLTNQSIHPSHVALVSFFKKIPSMNKQAMANLFEIITNQPHHDGMEDYLIPQGFFAGFYDRHLEKISDYCERFNIHRPNRPAIAKKSQELVISKELFDEFSRSMAPAAGTISIAPNALFLNETEFVNIFEESNKGKRIRVEERGDEYLFRIAYNKNETGESASVMLIGMDDVVELELMDASDGGYAIVSRKLLNDLDLSSIRQPYRIEIKIVTTSRQYQRRMAIALDANGRRMLMPPDWKKLYNSVATLARAEGT